MRRQQLSLFGLAAAFAGMVSWGGSAKTTPPKIPLTPALYEKGAQLYGQNCAACHGARGDGQGQAAFLLYPKPRNFTEGLFRLVSTADQQPSNDDLFNAITRGMPGSSMPPWNHLTNEDRWALVYYVRSLKEAGPEKMDLPLDKKMALAAVDAAADTRIAVPAEPAPSKEGAARGKIFFTQACASCHGPEGKGDGQQAMLDSAGLPVKPRDLTAGVFKGSSASDDLWYRLNAGLPGSPMPGYQGAYADDQMWDLIHFVQTLPKAGAEERARLGRHQIPVRRVKEKLDDKALAARWDSVSPVVISLTPLWWRNERIESVSVKALHNGKQIAIRLTWTDPTENNVTIAPQSFSDGGALQFSAAANPPFFGMGDKTGAVTFWSWKASWQKDLTAHADIQTAYPNAAVDWYPAQTDYKIGSAFEVKDSSVASHDPNYVTGWAAKNPLSDPHRAVSVEEARAKGLGSLTSNPPQKNPVTATGVWANGQWNVVFLRDLKVKDQDRLDFKAGQTIQAAIALWDGQARDRNGQKMVSIWNELKLEK